MAVGDVYQLFDATIGATEFLTMQPSAGVEVVVHNITVNPTDAASISALEFYDGTDAYVVDTITGSGSWMGMFLHCTNTAYYRVNPSDATNTKGCCDGMVTK